LIRNALPWKYKLFYKGNPKTGPRPKKMQKERDRMEKSDALFVGKKGKIGTHKVQLPSMKKKRGPLGIGEELAIN